MVRIIGIDDDRRMIVEVNTKSYECPDALRDVCKLCPNEIYRNKGVFPSIEAMKKCDECATVFRKDYSVAKTNEEKFVAKIKISEKPTKLEGMTKNPEPYNPEEDVALALG